MFPVAFTQPCSAPFTRHSTHAEVLQIPPKRNKQSAATSNRCQLGSDTQLCSYDTGFFFHQSDNALDFAAGSCYLLWGTAFNLYKCSLSTTQNGRNLALLPT